MKKFLFIIITIFFPFIMFGQTLNVHKNDGTIYNFDINEIDSITFSGTYQIITDGLVAYYPFTGDATDKSGNGLDGTVYGSSPTADRFGEPNGAYLFDGIDDYIEVLHDSKLHFENNFSLVAWVKNDIPNNPETYIIGKGDEVPYSMLTKSDKFSILIGTDRLSSSVYPLSQTGLDQEWHLIVGTYDGSEVKIFVDGALENTENYGESLLLDTGPMQFGGRPSTRNRSITFFKGIIDEIIIYNRALTAQEIQNMYN